MRKVFTLDLRSMALVRFLLGLLSFFSFFSKIPYATSFYSHEGIVSEKFMEQFFLGVFKWNLFYLIGSPLIIQLILFIALFLSVFFALGIRTKLSGAIIWFLLISFQGRFPLSLNGGDILLPLLFMWSYFLPFGKKVSWDSSFEMDLYPQENENGFFSLSCTGWFVQVFLIYFLTAIYKHHPFWYQSGEAMHYALELDGFTTPLGRALGQFKGLLPWMSRATFYLELLGPLLLFIPHQRLRIGLILSFIFFHLGIFLTFDIGVFPFICIVMWLLFLPKKFWEYFEKGRNTQKYTIYFDKDCGFCRRMANLICSLLAVRNVQVLPSSKNSKIHKQIIDQKSWCGVDEKGEVKFAWENFVALSEFSSFPLVSSLVKMVSSPFGQQTYFFVASRRYFFAPLTRMIGYSSSKGGVPQVLICSVLTFMSIWYNVGDFNKLNSIQMRSPFRDTAILLGLDQRWDMFGPYPATSEGWPVLVGKLKNGASIDPWNKKEVSFDKPTKTKYRSIFWRKSWERLSTFDFQGYRGPLVRYLCREWNQHMKNSQKELTNVRIYYLREHSSVPNGPESRLERTDLGSYSCGPTH